MTASLHVQGLGAQPVEPARSRPVPAAAEVPLSVYDLTVAYHRKPVLWDVSFDVPAGKLVGIVGPNGAGKSTLIKAVMEAFIYGKTASMVANDALLISTAGLMCAAVCFVLFKELKLLCFDEAFARARGLPVVTLDITLMALVVIVTIIGLQAVGLILMIAMLVIPAAAARFWTEKMRWMTVIAIALGAISGMLGAAASAVFPRLPSGAMIVLVAALFFLVSMILGPARGVLIRWLRKHRLNQKIHRQRSSPWAW